MVHLKSKYRHQKTRALNIHKNYKERRLTMHHIIAVLPEEVKGTGICARVYTETSTYIDKKTPTHFLNTLYKQKGKSKKLMDQQYKTITQITRNIPYTIDQNHVFFGFKYRVAVYDKDQRGFVNVTYVDHIKDSNIILTSGEAIATLNKSESLIQNRNYALIMLYRELAQINYENLATIRYLNAKLIKPN